MSLLIKRPRSTIFLHEIMLKLSKTKKRVTLSHHTGHATIANALIKHVFDRRQQRFLFSNDDRVPQMYCYRWPKNVILLSNMIFLTVGNALLRSLSISKSGTHPLSMYEPTK